MKEFFHSIRFRILVGIAAMLLGLMTYVAVSGGMETFPEQAINILTYPFVASANAISDGMNSFIDKWANADTYKQQNNQLAEQLNEMYNRTMDYESLLKENAQLREMLGMKEANEDFSFSEPCDIIARNANDIYGGFTVNKGTADGLSLNDPIITSAGLVGRVTGIAANYAVISTIISPQVNVGVYTTRAKTTGVLENDLKTASDGYCLMSDILKDADIEVGDVIFTSGVSGLFPDNIPVGTVVEVYNDPNGLSKHAIIQPAADILGVTAVFAITDFSGKGLSFDTDQ